MGGLPRRARGVPGDRRRTGSRAPPSSRTWQDERHRTWADADEHHRGRVPCPRWQGDEAHQLCGSRPRLRRPRAPAGRRYAMTDSPNVELVRSIYAALERGDFALAEWAHPQIEY